MAVIEINKNPSAKDLYWFGGIFVVFFALIGAFVWWRSGSLDLPYVIWAVAGAVAAVFWLVPPARKPIYLGWIYAAFPIGWVVSHVVMGVVYYGVVTPIGLLMRAFGRDPMQRAFDRQAKTYWVEHRTGTGDAGRYFRQF